MAFPSLRLAHRGLPRPTAWRRLMSGAAGGSEEVVEAELRSEVLAKSLFAANHRAQISTFSFSRAVKADQVSRRVFQPVFFFSQVLS